MVQSIVYGNTVDVNWIEAQALVRHFNSEMVRININEHDTARENEQGR